MDDAQKVLRNGGSAEVPWASYRGAEPVTTGKFAGAAMFPPASAGYWTHRLGNAGLDVSGFSLSLHVRTDVNDQSFDKDFISLGSGNGKLFLLMKNHEASVSLVNFGGLGGVESDDVVGSKTINDGQWHHLGVVSDGEFISLFIDGAFQGKAAYTGEGKISCMQLASRFGNARHAMHCSLDDVALYDGPLWPSQIQWLSEHVAVDEPPAEMRVGAVLSFGGLSIVLP
ncbi:LamG domain-containing protein [Verrucomicrobiaceae bacterium N1E253]|uniref:LamG domain-containing protein n=1 Tax=Oceaniferula marina TaxID=2748318 RepID=A0A851GJ23_9BACT|nr:LamG domain-containing protein [Oceaniferula marina]NWK55871.1 LamG domain-containing protein [Oceaniferula marina]